MSYGERWYWNSLSIAPDFNKISQIEQEEWMCILRNVDEDEVKAIRLNNLYLMLEMSYYFCINGYIYTTFALRAMSWVIQLMIVVQHCTLKLAM